MDEFLPNKNKEQIFLRLSEGFTQKNNVMFTQKLEKYRTVIAELRQNPKQLKLKLAALKPEIVRLLKKKRTTNANKRLKTWMNNLKTGDSSRQSMVGGSQYYRTPEKENVCPDYEQVKRLQDLEMSSKVDQQVNENR